MRLDSSNFTNHNVTMKLSQEDFKSLANPPKLNKHSCGGNHRNKLCERRCQIYQSVLAQAKAQLNSLPDEFFALTVGAQVQIVLIQKPDDKEAENQRAQRIQA